MLFIFYSKIKKKMEAESGFNYSLTEEEMHKLYIYPRMLESLAGCRTMFLFAVSCKIGALERNAY